MLVTKTVRELLDAFAAPAPTPGGGSAAALAGAMAAALLEMVASLPKTKHGTPEDRASLDRVLPAIRSFRATLTDLIDRDAASYDAVVTAYKLPKNTNEENAARKAAIRQAMRGATDVPLETARSVSALAAIAGTVMAHGNPNASSDTGVAVALLRSAYSGARANVETNLDSVGDKDYAAAARTELDQMTAQISALG